MDIIEVARQAQAIYDEMVFPQCDMDGSLFDGSPSDCTAIRRLAAQHGFTVEEVEQQMSLNFHADEGPHGHNE
jgi:hypothetical protein